MHGSRQRGLVEPARRVASVGRDGGGTSITGKGAGCMCLWEGRDACPSPQDPGPGAVRCRHSPPSGWGRGRRGRRMYDSVRCAISCSSSFSFGVLRGLLLVVLLNSSLERMLRGHGCESLTLSCRLGLSAAGWRPALLRSLLGRIHIYSRRQGRKLGRKWGSEAMGYWVSFLVPRPGMSIGHGMSGISMWAWPTQLVCVDRHIQLDMREGQSCSAQVDMA